MYSDEAAKAIVIAASKMTNTPVDQILEDFGVFIAPDLMKMYGSLVEPKWKTMDMLLYAEKTIHRVIRMRNRGAQSPNLLWAAMPFQNRTSISQLAVSIIHSMITRLF